MEAEADVPSMPNGSPKWKFVTRMTEPTLGHPVRFLHESKPFECRCARIKGLIAHERELWYGKPIARGDVKAIRGCIWDHYRTGHTDFFEDPGISKRHHIVFLASLL